MSDFTSARSFILREARLDMLDPGRSEMSRLINDAATKFAREWSRATEARLLSAAVGLADEYGERGAVAPRMVLVTFAHEPLRPGEPRIEAAS
jgi:hypothetical protein